MPMVTRRPSVSGVAAAAATAGAGVGADATRRGLRRGCAGEAAGAAAGVVGAGGDVDEGDAGGDPVGDDGRAGDRSGSLAMSLNCDSSVLESMEPTELPSEEVPKASCTASAMDMPAGMRMGASHDGDRDGTYFSSTGTMRRGMTETHTAPPSPNLI